MAENHNGVPISALCAVAVLIPLIAVLFQNGVNSFGHFPVVFPDPAGAHQGRIFPSILMEKIGGFRPVGGHKIPGNVKLFPCLRVGDGVGEFLQEIKDFRFTAHFLKSQGSRIPRPAQRGTVKGFDIHGGKAAG